MIKSLTYLQAFQSLASIELYFIDTEETLWLRILGSGKTQEQAVQEVLAMPETEPILDFRFWIGDELVGIEGWFSSYLFTI